MPLAGSAGKAESQARESPREAANEVQVDRLGPAVGFEVKEGVAAGHRDDAPATFVNDDGFTANGRAQRRRWDVSNTFSAERLADKLFKRFVVCGETQACVLCGADGSAEVEPDGRPPLQARTPRREGVHAHEAQLVPAEGGELDIPLVLALA